ncbi:nephrocystin-4 isoform X3 [Oryzias melastigma]|uniref:nephrocystin-4 isoform X3 n=1 Tax=Oryzias melastigma TaxID=30732 RepID=UPI00168CD08D|nr:nephrocystin-4 isoform X3 [Oryzias melastigma]
MVMETSEAVSREGGFNISRFVPPSGQTARAAAYSYSQSRGFQLALRRVGAAHLPQVMFAGEPDVRVQLRGTLFDQNRQHFFGRTWQSSLQKMNSKISFNEVLYFHTSLLVPGILVVLELVSISRKRDGSHQAVGRGFTVLELFSSSPDSPPVYGKKRLNLHHGTPRGLVHSQLKDTTDYSGFLKPIDEAHLECFIKDHPSLLEVMHLLPENLFVSGWEDIPGLKPSPTGDALLSPQLLEMMPFSLNRLTVSLQPSLETSESLLLQLINADCFNMRQLGPEDAQKSVVIQERRLHVGVYNGWGFLDKPQVVLLELVTDGSTKRSRPVKDSSSSSMLSLRSSVELSLVDHPNTAVVFQLEYAFSAPTGRESALSATSTSRAAILQCIRWGAWCPFQEQADWTGREIQLVLRGGSQPNPFRVLVCGSEGFTAASTSDSPQEAMGTKDMISFWFSSNPGGKAGSPKASLKSKKEGPYQSSSSSPSLGRKEAPPPESPRGPGLSLSQLAAPSGFPTLSHSSSALPWKHSFPSPLHLSPLASAHQLSHVAGSTLSNIAHLEMDLQPGAPEPASVQHNGDQLLGLPFPPVHAPAPPFVPRSGSVSALDHLISVSFPEVVDYCGQKAEVLDPKEPLLFNPQREDADFLQDNLLVFQFLAFTRTSAADADSGHPSNIYVTFQFYRFPPAASQQLRLVSSDGSEGLPQVLATVNKDGTVNAASPGLQLQFKVDNGFLRPGEKRRFLHYLAFHTLHLDIWDGDSLLLIGSTGIQLKVNTYLLRQGKPAVQALHELEVLTTDYAGKDTPLLSTDPGHRSAFVPAAVCTVVKGRLYVRTGNIGSGTDDGRQTAVDHRPSASHVITPCRDNCSFKGGRLGLQPSGRNTMEPDRLDCHAASGGGAASAAPEDSEARRQLDCTTAVRRREEAAQMKDLPQEVPPTGERHSVQLIAEPRKEELISAMLRENITTLHLLYASLGSAEFMEFVLKNPFDLPQTVSIHSDDPELSVITNAEEWRFYKETTQTSTPLLENLFLSEGGAAGPMIYLRPKESVHVPLKYQTFSCQTATVLQGPGFLPTGPSSQKNPSKIPAAKTVQVTFQAEDSRPVAILRVQVEPTPHLVDQTFRLYHPELCFLKKAIRLPLQPTAGEPDGRTDVCIRCSDPDILCQTTTLEPGAPQHVYLKVPGSPSPDIKLFFVMVFMDTWMAAPSQLWQIYIHYLEQVDVGCVTGQQRCQSVALRGGQEVHTVRCFPSHPREVQVDPAGVFVLPPGAVQELRLKLQPWQAGRRFMYVNAVEAEEHRLLAAWLLCLSIHQPVPSKAFELRIPVCGLRGSSRRFSYTNPYNSRRTFQLHSNHPDLLQFREDRFEIDGGESYAIGLRFAPTQTPGSAEILIYINNLDETTEETFCLKVNYS